MQSAEKHSFFIHSKYAKKNETNPIPLYYINRAFVNTKLQKKKKNIFKKRLDFQPAMVYNKYHQEGINPRVKEIKTMTKMEQMKQAMDNYLDSPHVIPLEDELWYMNALDIVAARLGYDLSDDEMYELINYYLG